MSESSDIVPYRKRGRLADVIAAIQVMASAERPEGKIKDLAYELDRNADAATTERWTSVFQEDREFFITYRLKGDEDTRSRRLIRRPEENIRPRKFRLFPRSNVGRSQLNL